MRSFLLAISTIFLSLVLFVAPARAYTIPSAPAETPTIVDGAHLLSASDRAAIEARHAPLTVVTVEHLADHGADADHIDALAAEWFATWHLPDDQILLLVSVSDRSARIQLGPHYGHTRDGDADAIMHGIMIPSFKAGEPALAIRRGSSALSDLAGGKHFAAPRATSSSDDSGMPGELLFVIIFFPVVLVIAIVAAAVGGGGSSSSGSSSDGGSSSFSDSSSFSSSSSDFGGGSTGHW